MRIRLSEQKLPDYTRGEELFNMISHIAGGAAFVALGCAWRWAVPGHPSRGVWK